jgi:hypothetical protein
MLNEIETRERCTYIYIFKREKGKEGEKEVRTHIYIHQGTNGYEAGKTNLTTTTNVSCPFNEGIQSK